MIKNYLILKVSKLWYILKTIEFMNFGLNIKWHPIDVKFYMHDKHVKNM